MRVHQIWPTLKFEGVYIPVKVLHGDHNLQNSDKKWETYFVDTQPRAHFPQIGRVIVRFMEFSLSEFSVIATQEVPPDFNKKVI